MLMSSTATKQRNRNSLRKCVATSPKLQVESSFKQILEGGTRRTMSKSSTTGISGGLIGGVVVMGVVCIGLFFFLLWKIKSNKKALESAKAYLKDQTEATKREREEGERALEEAAKGIYNEGGAHDLLR